MSEIDKNTNNGAGKELRTETESRFRLIVVAALRAKQLQRGAQPRITADPQRRRNTSIALEEVKRGLVPFTITGVQEKSENDASLLL